MANDLTTTEAMELEAFRERVRALDERVATLGRHL
jgi:hypothetical protein